MSEIAIYKPIYEMVLDDKTSYRISETLKILILEAQEAGEFFKFFEMEKYGVTFQAKSVKKITLLNPLPSAKEIKRKEEAKKLKQEENLENRAWEKFKDTDRFKELQELYSGVADEEYKTLSFYQEQEVKNEKKKKGSGNIFKKKAQRIFILGMIRKNHKEEVEKIKKTLTK